MSFYVVKSRLIWKLKISNYHLWVKIDALGLPLSVDGLPSLRQILDLISGSDRKEKKKRLQCYKCERLAFSLCVLVELKNILNILWKFHAIHFNHIMALLSIYWQLISAEKRNTQFSLRGMTAGRLTWLKEWT